MLAGAPLVVVQRVLRHKDPKLTELVYGHLTPGFLRAEVDRLRFLPVVGGCPRTKSTRSLLGTSPLVHPWSKRRRRGARGQADGGKSRCSLGSHRSEEYGT